MKNSIRILLAFIGLCSTQMNAQNEVFDNDNNAGDNSWNTLTNWVNGVLPTGLATIQYSVDLNGNQSIQQILAASSTNPIIVSGRRRNVLTLGAVTGINNTIDNEFRFDCNVTITKNSTFNNNSNNNNAKLVFLKNKTITLGSNKLSISNGESTNPIEFHGFLSGTAAFEVMGEAASTYGGITFSNTADNSNFTGTITTFGKSIISDISKKRKLFLPVKGILEFDKIGGTVTLNGANTMAGTILRSKWNTGSGEGTVVFNADQNNMAKLTLEGDNEMLTFDINASVDQLWFTSSDFSSNSSLNIVGFQDGVLGFGNTVSQTVLDTWKLDGVEPADGTLVQDENGFIIGPPTWTWTGTRNNSWIQKRNWVGNKAPSFTPTINVHIPAGAKNYPIIAGNETLTMNSGLSLTVDPGAMITNNGTFTNHGNLVLKSTISGTGYLVSKDKTVTNVTQQRYSSSNQRGWRLLSNPLGDISFGNFAGNSITPFTLGNNASGAYDPASNTWASSTDVDDMVSQQAYKIFMRGQNGEVIGKDYAVDIPSNVTMSIKGTARNATPQTIITKIDEFYLVANPYTAPVSLSSILSASTGLSTGVSYYDPTQGSTDVKIKAGGYWTDVIPAGTSPGSTYDVVLPPMGAIFVQATTAGTIDVPTSAIYTGPVTNSYVYNHKNAKESKTTDDDVVKLTMEVVSNGVYYDKLALQFKEEGTEGSNINFGKMQNTILDFFHVTEDTIEMAVSELELKEQIIPLGIYSYAFQNFTIHIKENSIPSEYEAVLKDALLNTSTVLTTGADYSFDLTSASETQGYERFSIVLKRNETLPVEEDVLSASIQVYPNPAKEQFNVVNNGTNGETFVEIYTVTGQLVYALKALPNTKTTVHVTDWTAGIYILKAMNNEASTTKKIIVQ